MKDSTFTTEEFKEVRGEYSTLASNLPSLDKTLFIQSNISGAELLVELRSEGADNINTLLVQDSSRVYAVRLNRSTSLNLSIIHFLSQTDRVDEILLLRENDILRVWSVVRDYSDENIRNKVYEKEKELINYFKNTALIFDFYLLAAEDVDDVLSSGAVSIYSRKK